jgi:hypothetical protein
MASQGSAARLFALGVSIKKAFRFGPGGFFVLELLAAYG